MGAGSDNEPLTSPGNFFPGRKRRVAELFAELLGRSFLPFPHFAAVDHHIMCVAHHATAHSNAEASRFAFSTFEFPLSTFPPPHLTGNSASSTISTPSRAPSITIA